MRTKMSDMKNIMDMFYSRLDSAEGQISELKMW